MQTIYFHRKYTKAKAIKTDSMWYNLKKRDEKDKIENNPVILMLINYKQFYETMWKTKEKTQT